MGIILPDYEFENGLKRLYQFLRFLNDENKMTRTIIIGHTGYTATCSTIDPGKVCLIQDASISHTVSTTCTSLSSATRNYPHEYTITRTPDPIDCRLSIYIERQSVFEEMKSGWLKPHKKLRPFSNNSKINYNLPRSRLREKKEIFLLKAA